MRVLAVDPGYARLGVAVLEKEPSQSSETLLYSGCIETPQGYDLTVRLNELGEKFTDLIREWKPDTVAIENIFFNKNQKTAVAVAEARGVLIYLSTSHKCQVHEYGPQEIKVAVTGHGGSDKTAVTAMVKRLVKNVPKKALDDEYDAIAVGITCLAHNSKFI